MRIWKKPAQKRAGWSSAPKGWKGQPVNVTLDTRKQLLLNISEIDSTLKDNRKRIGDLQARVKAFTGDIANLNKLVENLKSSILEREQSIAQLEAARAGPGDNGHAEDQADPGEGNDARSAAEEDEYRLLCRQEQRRN